MSLGYYAAIGLLLLSFRIPYLGSQINRAIMNPYELKPIGVVHSSLTDLADCPPQENEGAPEVTLEIHDAFVDGFANIEAGDRLILFTWLHKAGLSPRMPAADRQGIEGRQH